MRDRTGSISLDVALGIGGLPRGRVVEIYGPECSGKTSLALHAVASAQAAGGIAAFIDAEHAMDPEYAKKLGVDTDALLVAQPDTGEQALEIADMLIRSDALDIIVIDSVAALVPRAEIEGEMGDSHVGLQARLMSQALRKITGALSHSGTTAVFINQLREKIGVMFGSPETTTGGKALKFYASIRLDVRRIETLKDGTDAVGSRIRVKVVKNKVSPPFRIAEFDMLFGQGISREGGLIDMGVEHGFVRKAGAWYTYEGDQLGQGKENARAFLRDNPDLADEIEKRIKEKLGVGPLLDRDPGSGPGGRSTSEAGGRRRSRIRDLSPDPAVAARQARDLCLRMLTDRARTRHELAEALPGGVARPRSSTRCSTGWWSRADRRRRVRGGLGATAASRAGLAERRALPRSCGPRGSPEPEPRRRSPRSSRTRSGGRPAACHSPAAARWLPSTGRPAPTALIGLLARRGYPSDLAAPWWTRRWPRPADDARDHEDLDRLDP